MIACLRQLTTINVLFLLTIQTSQATLIDRGSGLIYDDELNVTWLADARYASTQGQPNNGQMSWQAAMDWATGLTYFDATRNVTWDDWRLPGVDLNDQNCSDLGQFTDLFPVPSGTNCTGSELGHLFYDEFDGVAGQHISFFHNDSVNLFDNFPDILESGSTRFWTSLDHEIIGPFGPEVDVAFFFDFANGDQASVVKNALYNNAWAVRDGDVGFVAIPEPTTLLLLGLALPLLLRQKEMATMKD